MACRPTGAACILTVVLGLALDGQAGSMDAPQGVVALAANEKDMVPCGGSAVLISADGLALTLAEALPGAHPGEDAGKELEQSVTVILGGGQSRAAEVV